MSDAFEKRVQAILEGEDKGSDAFEERVKKQEEDWKAKYAKPGEVVTANAPASMSYERLKQAPDTRTAFEIFRKLPEEEKQRLMDQADIRPTLIEKQIEPAEPEPPIPNRAARRMMQIEAEAVKRREQQRAYDTGETGPTSTLGFLGKGLGQALGEHFAPLVQGGSEMIAQTPMVAVATAGEPEPIAKLQEEWDKGFVEPNAMMFKNFAHVIGLSKQKILPRHEAVAKETGLPASLIASYEAAQEMGAIERWAFDPSMADIPYGAAKGLLTGGIRLTAKGARALLKAGVKSVDELAAKSVRQLPKLAKKSAMEAVEKVPIPERATGVPRRMMAKLEGDLSKDGISTQNIVEQMQKTLGTRINQKLRGAGKNVLGEFNRYLETGSVRAPNDISTLGHEFGHGLHKRLFGLGDVPGDLAPVADELEGLGRVMYPKKVGADARNEGFAEFMWHLLNRNEDVAQTAPNAWKWWNEVIVPREPKLSKQVEDLAKLVTEYHAQGAELKAASAFAPEGAKPLATDPVFTQAQRRILKAKERFWDPAAVLRKVEQEIDATLPEEAKASAWFDYGSPAPEAMTTRALMDEQRDLVGNRLGPAAREVLNPVWKRPQGYKELKAYHLAKHSQDLHARGIPTNLTPEEAAFIVRKYESNAEYLPIVRAQEGVTKFYQNELKLYMDEIGASELYDRFLKSNPNYLPNFRLFPDLPPGMSPGASASALYERKGSERLIKDYLENLHNYTRGMRSAALDAKMKMRMVELSKMEGAGRFIEEVKGQKIPPMVKTMAEVQDVIKRAGGTLTADDMDQVVQFFTGATKLPKGETTIAVRVGEETKYLRLHPDLYEGIRSMTDKDFHKFLRISNKIVGVQRLGITGIKPSFALRNFFGIDLLGGFLRDPTGKGVGFLPAYLGRNMEGVLRAYRGALGDLFPSLKNWKWTKALVTDPWVTRYRAQALELSELLAQDKNLRALLTRSATPTLFKDVKNLIRHPVDSLREFLGPWESGPRLAQYMRSIRKAGYKATDILPEPVALKAAQVARTVTADFSKIGTVAKRMNMVKPFFSARIAGVRMNVEAFTKFPKRTLMRGLTWITAPTLGLWWLNKDNPDYQDLPAWRRLGFFNIPIGTYEDGKTKWLSIPTVGLGTLLFKALPEAGMNEAYRSGDPELKSEDMVALLDELRREVVPVEAEFDDLPTLGWSLASNIGAAAPVIDVMANKRWPNRPIVPRSVEELPEKSKVAVYTSATARWIGSVLHMSPAQIDHLIGGYSGGALTDLISFIEARLGHPLKEEALIEAADNWLYGRFLPRELASSSSVQTMWDEYVVLKAQQNDWSDKKRDRKDGWREYRPSRHDQRRFTILQKAIEKFNAKRDKLDRVDSIAEAEKVRGEMIDIARSVVRRLNRMDQEE